MKAMTEREIQFVRARLDVRGDVSDVDIANDLQGSHYLERVRLTIAVDDFVKLTKDTFSGWFKHSSQIRIK